MFNVTLIIYATNSAASTGRGSGIAERRSQCRLMAMAQLRAQPAWLFAGSVFAIALVVALELVRPFAAGPVGFDSAASVIYFDRIVSGRHLEAFVTATPKPILTLVYGLLQGLTHDWRAISLATIAVFALSVVLAGWLAWRVAGPAAAVFGIVGLVGSEALLADVGIAYAVPWALLFWLVAGLAMTAATPRPGLAGLALCLATLARLETVVLVALAVLAVAIARALAWRKDAPFPRRMWLVAFGLASLPIMFLHDWLLTGDPFFWLSVSTHYSLATPDSVLTPAELARLAIVRYRGMWLLVGLAVVGSFALIRGRRWVPLLGVVGLGPGVGALLLILAARGTYVSPRYFAAIDLAVIFAAAIATGVIGDVASRALAGTVPERGRRFVAPLVIATAGIVAVAASWPIPSFNAGFRSSVRAQLTLAEHLDRTLPALRCELAPLAGTGPTGVIVLVPTLTRPRMAVDLDQPVSAVAGTSSAPLRVDGAFPPVGRIVVHDQLGDLPEGGFAILEIDRPTTIAGVTLVPILVDAKAGLWVLRIDRVGSPAAPAGC